MLLRRATEWSVTDIITKQKKKWIFSKNRSHRPKHVHTRPTGASVFGMCSVHFTFLVCEEKKKEIRNSSLIRYFIPQQVAGKRKHWYKCTNIIQFLVWSNIVIHDNAETINCDGFVFLYEYPLTSVIFHNRVIINAFSSWLQI